MRPGADQRSESRLPAGGFQVEIARHKWRSGEIRWCHLVDLSGNGLSFVSHDNHLGPLDKISFRLHVGAGVAEGKAVICYRRPESDSRWRYGAMFLSISPEVEELLQEEHLSTEEVRSVARQVADRMAMQACRSEARRRALRSRALLCEAVRAFLERLETLGHPLPQPVEVSLEEGVRVGKEASPLVVSALENGLGYASSRGEHFSNVFEVLEFLRAELALNQTGR